MYFKTPDSSFKYCLVYSSQQQWRPIYKGVKAGANLVHFERYKADKKTSLSPTQYLGYA